MTGMNTGHWIKKRAATQPNRIFIQDDHQTVINEEFNRRVNRMAHALMDLEVTKGDRVAIIIDNSIMFLEIVFACAKIGAILAPLNTKLSESDLVFILKDCHPKVLIHGPETEKQVHRIPENIPELKHIIISGHEGIQTDSLSTRANTADESEPLISDEIDLDDPFLIVYLPTTAGDPMGAVITHGNILFDSIHSLIGYGINASFKTMVVAPLFHIGGLAGSVFPVVYVGGVLRLETFYNPSRVLQVISRERINHMFAIPVMYQMLSKAPEWPTVDLSHVKFFMASGAPMPVPLIKKYQEDKGVGFVQGYGMTETGRLTALDLDEAIRKAGSVGKEVFHLDLRIVDDHDDDVPNGRIGEIIVRGPNVFKEYWQRPAETRAVFSDGWFHTGDLGRRDDEGFLFLEGRKIEMIISSGRNIYPTEIERVVFSLPKVKEAAVVGLPDPVKGQIVALAAAGQDGSSLHREDVINHLAGKIADYKMPRTIMIIDCLPRNPAGQIDRDAVRALFHR
jgi:fatty-acyl-CoA synthase